MSESFRFLQGSDFRLDHPMRNLAAVPAHLRTLVADAAYSSAVRFFDLAITESVDFVLLAGNLLDTELGSCRPATWLLNQFERLRDKGIRVYWCGGECDQPDRWPGGVELPDNVVVFPATLVEEAVFERQGKPVATILGASCDPRRSGTADFVVESTAPFPIALTCGGIDGSTPLARNVRYWAVGGATQPSVSERAQSLVVHSGTQQSRGLAETGAHGCHVVRVDSTGAVKIRFQELDAVRWLPQQVSIAESATLEEIQNLLGERSLKLLTEHPDRLLLVSWQVSPAGPFNPAFRGEKPAEQILKWLRDEFGKPADGLWSTSLQIAPPQSMPSDWYEEDTMLGDFLRAVGRYQGDESLSIALHEYLPESVEDSAVAGVIRVTGDQRLALLGEVAVLGAGYLAEGRVGNPVPTNS